jgi:acyl transferase domain-containing protein
MLASLGELYCQGAGVDWTGFDQDYPRGKVMLPTYPFQRERHWIQAGRKTGQKSISYAHQASDEMSGSPLPGKRISSPLSQIQFETQLDINSIRLVNEHRIYGVCVVPGVVYLEIAFAALEQVYPDREASFVLEDLALIQPLIMDEKDRWIVQLILKTEENGKTSFHIYSRAAGKEGADAIWRLHVTGLIQTSLDSFNLSAIEAVSVEEIIARCQGRLTGEEFYQRVWHPEFQLGPSFHCIDQVWRRDGEALGRLRFPTDAGETGVRPDLLVLDACVQLIIATLPGSVDPSMDTSEDVYIGAGEEYSCVLGPITGTEVWCQATLRSQVKDKDTLIGDLRVFDETGHVLAEITGARFKRVARGTLQRMARSSSRPDRPGNEGLSKDKILAAKPGERKQVMDGYVRGELSRVLGLEASRLDMDQPLTLLLDSLMAIELKNQVETDLEMTIPVALFFDGNSVEQFSGRLLDQVISENGIPQTGMDQYDPEMLEQLLAEIEELPEEVAQARLVQAKQTTGMEEPDD